MGRRKSIPSYRLHRQSGQAVVTLTDGLGNRRDVLLGRHDSPESYAEYRRVLAEWEAAGRRLPAPAAATADLTVNELLVAFWSHAEGHYRRPDGTPTSEINEYRAAFRPLKRLYGHTTAKSFGPLALKAVRQLMVDGYQHPEHGTQGPLSRGVINQRVGRIRRAFKWAGENELVPAAVHHALCDVRGLQCGRSQARETAPVRPVPAAVVQETLPFLNRHVRALVQVQLLTGARPGEVVLLRACDIDMAGKVWLYRPARHKTEHHGHGRVIAIGPKAQEVIRPFLSLDLQAYLFSPRAALAERRAELRRNRKTPVQPSQQHRRKRSPKRVPGEHYTTTS
jgi:integrase